MMWVICMIVVIWCVMVLGIGILLCSMVFVYVVVVVVLCDLGSVMGGVLVDECLVLISVLYMLLCS